MIQTASPIRKDIALNCVNCDLDFLADMHTLACEACQGPLVIKYDVLSGSQVMDIPVNSCNDLVTLGEGNTPIVKMEGVQRQLEMSNVYGKLEFMNPTGSFKDRGTSMMVSVAKALTVNNLVEDSSGNAGSSVAAYCSKAGITSHIFVPSSAPQPKLDQISVYGGVTHQIDGSREMVTEAALEFVCENGFIYGAHKLSPYFLEGTKSFAYELIMQSGHKMPDHIIMPVGNGSLYIGVWLGFKELIAKEVITDMPRMHVVQASAVKPLVNEFNGYRVREKVTPTVAGGISVSNPPRSEQIMEILNRTGGYATAVSDESILEWQKLLARKDGIYCEPTSASAFAGLDNFVEDGIIPRNDRVLVAITGFGLKDNLYT